mgnify:CR=1 FL=1
MKVVFITREGRNLAGARVRCYNFSRSLERYGIDTEVLSYADTLGAKDGQGEKELTNWDRLGYNFKAFGRLMKEPAGTIFYLQRVHYHSFAPWLLSLAGRYKLVLDLDDWEIRENPTYYLGIYPSSKAEFLTKLIAKGSCACICSSRYLVNFLLPLLPYVHYLPSGVDTDMFKSSNNRRGKDITFAWLGTFHRPDDVENVDFIVACFKSLARTHPRSRLDIVGKGIYFESIEKKIKDYGDERISLRGWIPHQEVPDYLSSIDIGLLPLIQSTKFNMSKSPTKLFEYMACSKPVIASRIGEAKEIIKDGEDGFLCSGKDEFIRKMEMLLVNGALRERMGSMAREKVKRHYSLSVLGARLFEILKDV